MMVCPFCHSKTSIEILTNKPFKEDTKNYYWKCRKCFRIIRRPKV